MAIILSARNFVRCTASIAGGIAANMEFKTKSLQDLAGSCAIWGQHEHDAG
jgi:hypothetical protein